MLWKYTARCALQADQNVTVTVGEAGLESKFPGGIGLEPGWQNGSCDRRCQEKVSACLLALVNRTGKHVALSLLSAAPSLVKKLGADDHDLAFPHQEGTFFGNVFENEGFVCRGTGAEKAAQVKRFCALDPASCEGLVRLTDAGLCRDACEMSCTRLSDGTQRCAATRCQDPRGRTWDNPITIYLRNRIEAENADAWTDVTPREHGLETHQRRASATFRAVDFGRVPGSVHRFVAGLTTQGAGGRIELWLDGKTRRLGVLPVEDTGGSSRDLGTAVDTRGLSGPHDVVVEMTGLVDRARLDTVELR